MKKLMLLGLIALQSSTMLADEPQNAEEALKEFANEADRLHDFENKIKTPEALEENLEEIDSDIKYLYSLTEKNIFNHYTACSEGVLFKKDGTKDNKKDCFDYVDHLYSYMLKARKITEKYFDMKNQGISTNEFEISFNKFKAEVEKEIAAENENQKQ